jgi:hypothetical protein
MATDVFINIKDLPELTEVSNGDYIIVESTTGTHLIDFKNLIMPTANTIISNTVAQNTNAILSLSTARDTTSSALTADVQASKTNISTMSGQIIDIMGKNILNLNVAKTQITISPGNKMSTGTWSQTGNWTLADVFITPANDYAAKFGAYPVSVSTKTVTIQGAFTRTSLILRNTPFIAVESSARPSTTALSGFTVGGYTDTLSLNPNDLDNFLTSFSLSSVDIPAEDDAVYNVYAFRI